MTDDRDPGLQALFDAAPAADANDAFVEQVMADIDRLWRRTIYGWILVAVVLAPVAWWLAKPVASTFSLAARLMPDSLVDIEAAWLDQLLSPVNSVAGVTGLLFLAGWLLYRKILRG